MKLGYCISCKDMFKLTKNVRGCSCGKCSGRLRGHEFAIVLGPIKVIGINEGSFQYAIDNQPNKGPGKEFVAYVLPHINKNVQKITISPIKVCDSQATIQDNVYKPKPIVENTQINSDGYLSE